MNASPGPERPRPTVAAIAAELDAALGGPLLVHGSLPPHGHDLDLLVPQGAEAELCGVLVRLGFERFGSRWIRFDRDAPAVVEATSAETWRLSPPELGALFAEATPVDGYRSLLRPAPHHALLILARRFVRSDGRLDDPRRRRAEAALRERPTAWAEAHARAPAWRARRALRLLEAAYADGSPARRRDRVAALVEGRGLRAVRRRRRGLLVTFSGLDGSGKTTQCKTLCQTLQSLDHDAVRVWTSLPNTPTLGALSSPVKAVLRAALSARRLGARTEPAARRPRVDDAARRLRARNPVLTHAWATLVAAANAEWHIRAVERHRRRGRIVVCDRYVLDSLVNLRYRYGPERSFRLGAGLLRTCSPRPDRSYFLDVPPAVSVARVGEYTDAETNLRAELYREEARRLRLTRLDGERPTAELSAEIVRDVLRLLAGR